MQGRKKTAQPVKSSVQIKTQVSKHLNHLWGPRMDKYIQTRPSYLHIDSLASPPPDGGVAPRRIDYWLILSFCWCVTITLSWNNMEQTPGKYTFLRGCADIVQMLLVLNPPSMVLGSTSRESDLVRLPGRCWRVDLKVDICVMDEELSGLDCEGSSVFITLVHTVTHRHAHQRQPQPIRAQNTKEPLPGSRAILSRWGGANVSLKFTFRPLISGALMLERLSACWKIRRHWFPIIINLRATKTIDG